MNVLLTGGFRPNSEQREVLQRQGWSIIDQKDESNHLDVNPESIDAIVCNRFFDHHDLAAFKNLKLIQLTSAGSDQIPMEQMTAKGIRLFTAKGVYSIPIAEWTVLKILEIGKKSRVFENQQRDHQWQKQRDILELTGLTALVIGFGDIGIEIARRLRPFGVKVIGVGRRDMNAQHCDEFILIDAVDHYLPQSDMTIITLPLSEATHHFLDDHRLQLCKDDSILVNISRGKIIDEQALIQVIRSGKFRGVALDVFEEEPLPQSSPLWDLDNVLVTPHNAFVSGQNQQRLFETIVRNLESYLKPC